jgi:hypothetical protein
MSSWGNALRWSAILFHFAFAKFNKKQDDSGVAVLVGLLIINVRAGWRERRCWG